MKTILLIGCIVLLAGCLDNRTKIVYNGPEGVCTYLEGSFTAHCYHNGVEVCSYDYRWSERNGHWCH